MMVGKRVNYNNWFNIIGSSIVERFFYATNFAQ